MKKFLSLILLACLLCTFTQSVTAGEKQEKRVSYIISGIKVSKDKARQLQPVVAEFVDRLHANKKKHDALKEKYAKAEEDGRLTDAQADELMQSKFAKDTAENQIRKTYYDRFKALVGAAKARKILSLSDDKLKKK